MTWKKFAARHLIEIVSPIPLKEVLEELKAKREISHYRIRKYSVLIKLTKLAGLDMLLKEASNPVINPRPYVANKTTNWKRKRLRD